MPWNVSLAVCCMCAQTMINLGILCLVQQMWPRVDLFRPSRAALCCREHFQLATRGRRARQPKMPCHPRPGHSQAALKWQRSLCWHLWLRIWPPGTTCRRWRVQIRGPGARCWQSRSKRSPRMKGRQVGRSSHSSRPSGPSTACRPEQPCRRRTSPWTWRTDSMTAPVESTESGCKTEESKHRGGDTMDCKAPATVRYMPHLPLIS
jgi:hypothetical protein